MSTDPFLIDKVRDVVGLYLSPLTHTAVFSADEKPQIQALERAVPVLPTVPGTLERRSHDYRRHGHGTIDLLATLNTATGKWVKFWDEDAKPFKWTKKANQIISAIGRCHARISGPGH